MRRTQGQSLVEMALLMPLLLMLIFGIIDFGWYVFGYSSIYQASRNGSEAAAQLPPFTATLGDTTKQATDPCYQTVLAESQRGIGMFDVRSGVSISYPNGTRELGQDVQVVVIYQLDLLTPLAKLIPIGNNGRVTITASSVRAIESLGYTPPSATNPNGIICR